MRERILLGELLTNVEHGINISKKDLEELEKQILFFYGSYSPYQEIQARFPQIIYHFTTCEAYRNEPLPNWHEINGTDTDKILTVGLAIERRVE